MVLYVAQHYGNAEAIADWVHGHDVAGALLLGSSYGLLRALPPDHVCTIVTLSAASDDVAALRVGTAWGLSHAAAAGLVILGLGVAEYVSGVHWGCEALSESTVGIAMILCAAYFATREDDYIKENPDGTQTVLACDCCASSHAGHKHGTGGSAESPGPAASSSSRTEHVTGTQGGLQLFGWGDRDVSGAVMGAIQGACCPMTFAGTAFVGFLSTPARCAAFGMAFLVCTTASTGLLALLCSRLTREGCSWLAPKTVYRATCALTVILGTACIMADGI